MLNVTSNKQFAELTATLEVLGLNHKEFLIVGTAAECLMGLVKPFADIDVVVSNEVFKRLMGNQFEVTTRGSDSNRARLIAIGHVKVIEANTDMWLNKLKHMGSGFPTLNTYEMIDWRIWMGREKDLLRAWELVYKAESNLPCRDNIDHLNYISYVEPNLKLLKSYKDILLNSTPNDLG